MYARQDLALFCQLIPLLLGGFTFKTCVSHFLPSLCNSVTRQAIKLGSCSNPQKIWRVFKFGFFKNGKFFIS